jgi:hypothetical protein
VKNRSGTELCPFSSFYLQQNATLEDNVWANKQTGDFSQARLHRILHGAYELETLFRAAAAPLHHR